MGAILLGAADRVDQLKEMCALLPECAGFSTSGWLKTTIATPDKFKVIPTSQAMRPPARSALNPSPRLLNAGVVCRSHRRALREKVQNGAAFIIRGRVQGRQEGVVGRRRRRCARSG